MVLRITATIVVISLAAIIFAPMVYERISGVGVVKRSTRIKQVKPPQKRRPTSKAYIVGGSSESEEPRFVLPLYSFTDVYASMGVGNREFSQWLHKYGVTLSGRNREGLLLVPGYPIFSKIAWMGIDVIDLSFAETQMLVDECTKVKKRSVGAEASAELDALETLAQEAVATGGTVRFGLK